MLWAGLYLLEMHRATGDQKYLNTPKKWNGARGATQIKDEVQ